MIKIYKVLRGGRRCLSDTNGRILKAGDFIHGNGVFMVKCATATNAYCSTSMFSLEVTYEKNEQKYKEATPDEVKRLIPHLANGKVFGFSLNLKSGYKKQYNNNKNNKQWNKKKRLKQF